MSISALLLGFGVQGWRCIDGGRLESITGDTSHPDAVMPIRGYEWRLFAIHVAANVAAMHKEERARLGLFAVALRVVLGVCAVRWWLIRLL